MRTSCGGEHTALLREVLRKVLDGSLQIQKDVVSNCYDRRASLAQLVREQLPEGYLFYDWFAVLEVDGRAFFLGLTGNRLMIDSSLF